MAPRFKRNQFWCWRKDDIVMGLIGFSSSSRKSISQFRDEITEIIIKNKNLIVNKQQGGPTPIDSWFKFFNKEDEFVVRDFFSRPASSFLATIFKNKGYKDWNLAYERINKMVKADLQTSHDFPCLIISGVAFSIDEIFSWIQEVANILSLELHKNSELEKINEVIMSNRTFE